MCAARKDLYLMGLLPMTGDGWPGGGACLPALEMAIRHVNARDDILPDYKLNLIWKDTSVSNVIFLLQGYLISNPVCLKQPCLLETSFLRSLQVNAI